MATVSTAQFKDRLSEYMLIAERGEEVVVTKHGSPRVKLTAIQDDATRAAKARKAVAEIAAFKREHGPFGIRVDEIVTWVREDRD